MKVLIASVVALYFLAGTLSFAAHPSFSGEVIDFGVMELQVSDRPADADSPIGKEGISNDLRIVKQTNTIPAQLKMQFGFLFRIDSVESVKTVQIQEVYTFPRAGVETASGTKQKRYVRTREVFVGELNLMAYELTEEREVLPGAWKFEIKADGRTLISKEFLLTEKDERQP